MIRSFEAINLRLILITFFIIFIALFLGKSVAHGSFAFPFFLIFGVVIFGVVLVNTEIGFLFIIFSMLLSPELKTGVISGRDIVFRSEDFLLIIVTFTWLVKTALKKESILFKKTPLNLLIGIYSLTCVLLTLRGMLFGYVIPLKGFFYLLKYMEYFLLYFMVANEVRTRRQIEVFVIAFLLTCAITSLYADLHIGEGRVTAPFEGTGEPNTLGGYLVFMLAMVMGIFLYASSPRVKFWLGVLVLFLIIPAFLFTLSRTAYLSIVPMWIGLIIFGPKKKMLIAILLLSMVVGFSFMPRAVQERIEYTFQGDVDETIEPVVIGSVSMDPSSSARIRSWQAILRSWQKCPIVGYGITGAGFVDGQYVLILGELGLMGFLIFLLLLRSIFKHTRQIFLKVEDRFFKGLSLGFLAGVIGLFVFNGGANGFVVTRIMEPFWFMAGIVMMLPEIEKQEGERGLQQV